MPTISSIIMKDSSSIVYLSYFNWYEFRCTLSDIENFKSGKLPVKSPAKAYANTLVKGLVEGKQLSEAEAIAYIEEASTKPL